MHGNEVDRDRLGKARRGGMRLCCLLTALLCLCVLAVSCRQNRKPSRKGGTETVSPYHETGDPGTPGSDGPRETEPDSDDASRPKDPPPETPTEAPTEPADDPSLYEYEVVPSEGIRITRYIGCRSSVEIPTVIDNVKVTSIGGAAFRQCKGLTSVKIPDGVTRIEWGAFEGCSDLATIMVPDSVTRIDGGREEDPFRGTAWYDHQPDGLIYIGKVAYQCKGEGDAPTALREGTLAIADEAFAYRDDLTSFTIPSSVVRIGKAAFRGCEHLASVTIEEGVTSIGDGAFSRCPSLASFTIPDSVQDIGRGAFADTAWYESQPDGLVYAGRFAYEYKGEMFDDTAIVLRDGTIGILDEVFWGKSELTSLAIPSSVTSIGSYAFYECYGLTSIEIPSGVTSISTGAFRRAGLTSVEIPSSVTSIGVEAFSGCEGLTSVRIPSSVTWLGRGAFEGCSHLTSVEIPSSLTSVSVGAFAGCERLTSVEIPSSVTVIEGRHGRELERGAFEDCKRLTSIEIPSSVTRIENYAFEGCSDLTSVTIPSSVTSIGRYAFSGCTDLTSITIPEGVTSIGDSAFSDCTRLASVTIPDSVTSVGLDAFANTSWYDDQPDGLVYAGKVAYSYKGTMPEGASIVLRDGTTCLVAKIFKDGSGLTSVKIPSSVTSIGEQAFKGCTGLTSVEIPSSVTSIGEAAFKGCTGLTSVEIPSSVTSIGGWAFSDCTGLASVTIPEGVTSIGRGAFDGCALRSLTIPSSVTRIGQYAFGDTPWYNDQPDGLVYAGKVAYSYKGSVPENTSLTLREGTTGIAVEAFRDRQEIVSITIPSSVTFVGSDVFRNWLESQTIYIEKGADVRQWDRNWKYDSDQGRGACRANIVFDYVIPSP